MAFWVNVVLSLCLVWEEGEGQKMAEAMVGLGWPLVQVTIWIREIRFLFFIFESLFPTAGLDYRQL